MSKPTVKKNTIDFTKVVKDYVGSTSGLSLEGEDTGLMRIKQRIDSKELKVFHSDIEDIISRSDERGMAFLQVNFANGKKILITDTLIGFKPLETAGLDMSRLPKVVTTPDVLSVFEAIEEAIGVGDNGDHEMEVLKKVYMAIIKGGESVGFDLSEERKWLERLLMTQFAATA